jgi:hypothetical protein
VLPGCCTRCMCCLGAVHVVCAAWVLYTLYVLPGCCKCCNVLPGYCKCCNVLPGYCKCCNVLPGCCICCNVLYKCCLAQVLLRQLFNSIKPCFHKIIALIGIGFRVILVQTWLKQNSQMILNINTLYNTINSLFNTLETKHFILQRNTYC